MVGRRRVSSLAAQLGSGKVGQLGTGKAVSGRPLPAGEAASWGGAEPLRMHPRSPTYTALVQPVWEERAQSRRRGA